MEALPFAEPDNLDYMITTEDFAGYTKLDMDAARHEIRKYKQVLQPFTMGRSQRILAENFRLYLAVKLSGANPEKS